MEIFIFSFFIGFSQREILSQAFELHVIVLVFLFNIE